MCDHYSCISGPRQLNLLNRQSADWPAAASRDKSDFFPPPKNNFLHFLFWCFFLFVGSVTDWAKVTELHKRIASDGILVEIHLISALFFRHPAELWSRSIRRQAANGQRRFSGGLRAAGKKNHFRNAHWCAFTGNGMDGPPASSKVAPADKQTFELLRKKLCNSLIKLLYCVSLMISWNDVPIWAN